MFSGARKRSKKTGQPPGTLIYTGNKKKISPRVSVLTFSATECYEKSGSLLSECLPTQTAADTITWINVQGLTNPALIDEITKQYNLHPLTVEDILSVEQRSKVEEFEHYLFITLKMLFWNDEKRVFTIKELSIVIGSNFILTFQEDEFNFFDNIHERIKHSPHQGLRKQRSDYLAYRFIDLVVDYYFLVLEGIGDQIEKVEDLIIANPTKQTMKNLYRLKRQMLLLRKIIWPIREVINHLLKIEGSIIARETHIYFRDVYDHAVQAIDTIETFRDMLSNMLDIYLSNLTNRMNEIMKVLTIITTTFIPVTFIASIYGMNFEYMPELRWKWGYPIVLFIMLCVILSMAYFFRRKKWW